MMTPAEAANKVKETQGYEWVLSVKDYDAQHYVVQAYPKKGKLSIGVQTSFGVDKNTGAVTAFMVNQGNNFDKLRNAKDCEF